jgi:lipopolysaccharide biosynthesis regulator YciM
LKECAQSNEDAFTHLALARYLYNKEEYEGAVRELDSALELDPMFWEARRFKGEILLALGMREDALTAYQDLIAHLHAPYLQFQCTHCGFKPPELHWQCPQCKEWDTIQLMDSAMVESETDAKTLPAPTSDLHEKSSEEEV